MDDADGGGGGDDDDERYEGQRVLRLGQVEVV